MELGVRSGVRTLAGRASGKKAIPIEPNCPLLVVCLGWRVHEGVRQAAHMYSLTDDKIIFI